MFCCDLADRHSPIGCGYLCELDSVPSKVRFDRHGIEREVWSASGAKEFDRRIKSWMT
jgi:hypothetical protein